MWLGFFRVYGKVKERRDRVLDEIVCPCLVDDCL